MKRTVSILLSLLMIISVFAALPLTARAEGFTVKFDPGEGTGKMKDMVVPGKGWYTLPPCTFYAPVGKKFEHWMCNSSSGTYYATDERTILIDEDMTLTALWYSPYDDVYDEPEPEDDLDTYSDIQDKEENPIKVSVKTKSVKLNKLKKKAQTVKAITIKSAKGKVSCKIKKAAKIKKFLKIDAKGVITFNKWKKAKKGTYKVKVSVTAKGNGDYNKKTVSKIVKIKVK